MFSPLLRRFLSTEVAKSPLAVLRRKTGYPMGKCREALVRYPDSMEAAEGWLKEQAQKQGWMKAEQLRGRTANHGHIGLLLKNDRAAIIEVNCETDFVAKNDEFKELVSTVTQSLFNSREIGSCSLNVASNGSPILADQLSDIEDQHGQKIPYIVAKAISRLSENIKVSRGYLLTAKGNGWLASYVYNGFTVASSGVEMGRYVAIAGLSATGPDGDVDRRHTPPVQQLGRQLCQQIVGNNPYIVSRTSPVEALTQQTWLFDPQLTVNEVLANENLAVDNFVRCECSETS